MASELTDSPVSIDPIGPTLGGYFQQTMGRNALVGGTIELDTGLQRVTHISCMCLGDTTGKTVVFRALEDFPSNGGIITIEGTLVVDGGATAAAGAEEFSWHAIGE